MQTQLPEELKVNYIPSQSNLSWDEYFILQAMISAFKSKDPVTKVGCVIVNDKNHQVTMGYNGFVAGIDENLLPWGKNKSVPLEHQKYGYVVHAEANAILHAEKSLEGCTAYVTHFPCNECAKLLASKRIKKVVYLSDKHKGTDSHTISRKIFELAGVGFQQLDVTDQLIDKLNEHLHNLRDCL